jgi:MFS family permease
MMIRRLFCAAPVYRNVAVLGVAQILFQSVQAMAIATTPLVGHMLLGSDKSLATLPIFLIHAAVMVATVPASYLMQGYGRRVGFTIGGVAGVSAGSLSAAAVFQQSFIMLCAGTVLQGVAAAFAWYYRFAAADAADASFRAKAISLVLAGGVVAGYAGPEIAKWSVDWFAPVIFAGVYVAMAIAALLGLLIIQCLRIPTLTAAQRAEKSRSLVIITRQPAFVTAVFSSMLGYGVMTLVMSATPLAMLACGYGFRDSATVIEGHGIAMFLPSFFTGHLIMRVGLLPVIVTGAVIEAGCAAINLAGIDFLNFMFANILVGLGWNFTYVGGSTLLTSTYYPAERGKVQGAHDFAVYSTTALAAAASGFLQARAGWDMINLCVFPMMALVIFAALRLALRQRRVTNAI